MDTGGGDEGGDANESGSENAGEESQPDEDKGVSSDEHWKEIDWRIYRSRRVVVEDTWRAYDLTQ